MEIPRCVHVVLKREGFFMKITILNTCISRRNFSFPASSPAKLGSLWNSAPSLISSSPKVRMSSARRRIVWPRSFACGVAGVIRSGSLNLKNINYEIKQDLFFICFSRASNLVLSSGLALLTPCTSAARKFLKNAVWKRLKWSD